MRLALILAALMGLGLQAFAQTTDTPANRTAAAEQYVTESGLQQMISESTNLVVKGFSPKDQASVTEMFTRNLDAERLKAAMVTAMAQRFTVEEIQAIRKFAGSPAGKSVMGKLSGYMNDIVPTIETVTADATGKVLLELRRRSRPPPAGQK